MGTYTHEELCTIWLQSARSLSWKTYEKLMDQYGDPPELFEYLDKDCITIAGEKVYKELRKLKKEGLDHLEDELKRIECKALFPWNEDYPVLLREIADPPHMLFGIGESMPDQKSVAIVGSRHDTRYGRTQAFEIAKKLAQNGVTIISGLARGIDTAAHEGALAGGGRTVAVLGCGIDRIYPEENKPLAQKIVDNGGMIVSEFPLGSEPLAHHFPIRNRIISGMSAALLLIEGGARSGTMITANYAAEQGRDVFALPGNVDAPGSAAPLKLLRDGAGVCTCAHDILEDMKWSSDQTQTESFSPPEELYADLPARQRHIALLLWGEELMFDEIMTQTGFSADDLTSELTLMELDGIIETRAGHAYAINMKYKNNGGN